MYFTYQILGRHNHGIKFQNKHSNILMYKANFQYIFYLLH